MLSVKETNVLSMASVAAGGCAEGRELLKGQLALPETPALPGHSSSLQGPQPEARKNSLSSEYQWATHRVCK